MFTSKNTETRALCRSGLDLAVIWHLLAHFLVSRRVAVAAPPSSTPSQWLCILQRFHAGPLPPRMRCWRAETVPTRRARHLVFSFGLAGARAPGESVTSASLPPRHSTAPTMSTFDPEVPSPGEEAPPGEPNCSTGTLTASPWEALGPTVGHYAPAPRPDVYTSFPGYHRDLTGGPGLVYGGACEASGLRNGLPPNVRP